ncbi:MAG: zinc ribbon domain-containing protein [Planctomycetota bacterium]
MHPTRKPIAQKLEPTNRKPDKTCSHCGYVNHDLTLKDRFWDCQNCHTKRIPRDWNASVNICRVGASTLKLGDVRQSQTAISA